MIDRHVGFEVGVGQLVRSRFKGRQTTQFRPVAQRGQHFAFKGLVVDDDGARHGDDIALHFAIGDGEPCRGISQIGNPADRQRQAEFRRVSRQRDGD